MGNSDFTQAKSGGLSPQISVAELLRVWPQTIPVFFKHRMACVGCWMAPFDTLEDAARNYSLDIKEFLIELDNARQNCY